MHHDYIDPNDIPREWLKIPIKITLDVEARAKELALIQIQKDMMTVKYFLEKTLPIQMYP